MMVIPLGRRQRWMGVLIVAGVVTAGIAAEAGAAVPPFMNGMPVVSAATLLADDATPYTVTLSAGDPDGYNDIRELRVIFNYTEAAGNSALGRGYLAWAGVEQDVARFGGSWTVAPAGGGGYWGYRNDAWGGTTYITPLSCTTSVSGQAAGGLGTRTVIWTFRVKPAWGLNPLTNDADASLTDWQFNTGWLDNPADFEVMPASCASTSGTPRAPLTSNPTPNTVDVAIHPSDSAVDLFAIQVSPAVNGNRFVQPDGRLGSREAWLTRDQWGVTTVTGLMWNTTYTFAVRATRFAPGHCPSPWGPGAPVSTLEKTPRIDLAGGLPFNPGVRGQCPIRDAANDAIGPLWDLATGASGRGIAGGLDADTYDWRNIYSGITGGRGGSFTTLQFLQMARDYAAEPVFTANLFGGGARDQTGAFICETVNPEGLAADWVRYVNHILPNYRQGQEGQLAGEDLRVYNAIINWAGRPRLLSAGEAITPRVNYWEIGNEPELGAIGGYLGNHYLGPEDYRDRFKSISTAMRAVDSALKIGPCLMDPPNAGGTAQWLEALAADPAAQIDFVAYHPYYQDIKWNWGSPPNMTAALRGFKAHLAGYASAVHAIMSAHGRSGYELMATEWNPVNWDASAEVQSSMACALGVVEGVFSFAEQGVTAAHFWVHPQYKLGPRDVFAGLAADMGDTLVATMNDFGLDPAGFSWRVYVTKTAADPNRLAVWGLNFDEHVPVDLTLQLPPCRVVSATLKRYGIPGDDAAGGDTSLMHHTGMAWEQFDVTAGVDSRRLDFRIEDAEVAVLLLEIAPVPAFDHDRDGDVDMDDFGWFQACLSGPGIVQPAPDCADALGSDFDVDGEDLEAFRQCLSGPNIEADPDCAG